MEWRRVAEVAATGHQRNKRFDHLPNDQRLVSNRRRLPSHFFNETEPSIIISRALVFLDGLPSKEVGDDNPAIDDGKRGHDGSEGARQLGRRCLQIHQRRTVTATAEIANDLATESTPLPVRSSRASWTFTYRQVRRL